MFETIYLEHIKSVTMNKKIFNIGFLALLLTVFSGCTVIGGIFKAGVWSGIIIIVVVVLLIIFIVGKMGKRN